MPKIILPVFSIITILLTIACNNKSYPNGDSFPGDTRKTSKEHKPVVTRDGTVIDKNGRVVNAKDLPPGQAKKVYGAQSAKAFAPGQRKKAGKKLKASKHNHDDDSKKKLKKKSKQNRD